MSKMTNKDFARQAAYMAAEAANWSADVLTLPEEADEFVRDWSMDRFLTNMRERLARIEDWSKEPIPSKTNEA